jgi:hypothetical protein
MFEPFFLTAHGTDNMLSTLFLEKKNNQTTRHLFYPDFGYCGGRKIRVSILLTPKLIFQLVVFTQNPYKTP